LGYIDGYTLGYIDGYSQGYSEGYNNGIFLTFKFVKFLFS